MNRVSFSAVRRSSALAAALTVALSGGGVLIAPAAHAQGATDQAAGNGARTLDDAEFRWGVNPETGSRSHDPTAFNMMSAGLLTMSEPKRITEADWSGRDGNVTLEKRWSDGELTEADWDGLRSDRSGGELSSGVDSYNGVEMVFRGGEGEVNVAAGTAEISWEGSVTVLYYQGDSVFTLRDPELTVTESSAEVTATVGGYRSSRTDSSLWEKTDARSGVVIATIDREAVELDDETGFSISPEYDDVTYSKSDIPGSFPEPFVDYLDDVGIGAFFYSTGGVADPKKRPLPITVSWDSDDPADVTEPGGSKGLLGRVLDDTVEDILRAAGTDVADTAAAWMDEAWKPLQPEAVKAAPSADVPPQTAVAAEEVVVDETFGQYHEEYYTSTSAMTAGTVGGTVAAIPASTPAGSPGSVAAAPASGSDAASPLSEQTTMPVAANLPLTDVVYAQTSASLKAGNPLAQWQWWVGAALLALAAVLFSQTVRRKD
ncbi:HtaA domain-containing protein [Dietzia lutea]|uniref:Uncharacterized protein n=1 Tax=Dietzia lutea TaxID=546160 RepID=A0A2S1R5G1_9ACTN|nr:HtaA domain-containing protein [Dietzia lutea]AWH91491.1 hypothetical protein A6035_04135 [Dietzia lutea]